MQSTTTESPFASVMGLGPLVAEHKLKTSNRWTNLGCAAFSILLAPLACGGAAFGLYDTYSRYGMARIDNEAPGLAIVALFGVGALALGVWMLYTAWRDWKTSAALYENGFAYVDRKGLQQVRWDQVEAVWQAITKHYRNGIYTGTTHVYTIQTQDKQKVVLDDKFDKIADLGGAIQKGTTNVLYPRYVAALQSGQRLTFGPLAIDGQGIYSGNKSLLWSEIKAIKLNAGNISVKKEGGWFNWASATVPQIPNFFIFYDLISRLTKVE